MSLFGTRFEKKDIIVLANVVMLVAFVVGTVPLLGVLGWFEVDLSARPASSFGVICVLSILVISAALRPLSCCPLLQIS
jgi:hypothetical protein